MKNRVLEKIEQGEKVLGTFVELEDANAIECLGLAGLDFFVFDTEHGPWEAPQAVQVVRAAKLRGVVPFARIKGADRASVIKMLDIGMQGVIVPCIRNAEEVRKLVSYGKFPPQGKRGVAMGREGGWGFAPGVDGAPITDYMEEQNRETMILPQCETLGCLEQIEEIAAIEGVDGIFLGPMDLSTELGCPCDYKNPAFTAAVERILSACRIAGKPLFVYCPTAEAAAERFRQGFSAAAVGTDTALFIQALRNMAKTALGASDVLEG